MSQEPDRNIVHIQAIENYLSEIEQELLEIEAMGDEHLVSIILHHVKHIECEALLNLRRALENSSDFS